MNTSTIGRDFQSNLTLIKQSLSTDSRIGYDYLNKSFVRYNSDVIKDNLVETGDIVYVRIEQFIEKNIDLLNIEDVKEVKELIDKKYSKIESETGGWWYFLYSLIFPQQAEETECEKGILVDLSSSLKSIINTKEEGSRKVITTTLFDPPWVQSPSSPAPPVPGKKGAVAAGPRVFSGEPTSITAGDNPIKPGEYKRKDQDTLRNEIKIIEQYLEQLNHALEPVRKLVAEDIDLDNKIQVAEQIWKEKNAIYSNNQSDWEELKNSKPEEVVYLSIINKKTKAVSTTPYFPKSELDTVNKRREAKFKAMNKPESQRPESLLLIPEYLEKNKARDRFEQLAAHSKVEADSAKVSLDKLINRKGEIQQMKNNEHTFAVCKKMLEEKESTIKILHNGLLNRQKELANPTIGAAAGVVEKKIEEKPANRTEDGESGEAAFDQLPLDIKATIKAIKDQEAIDAFYERHEKHTGQ